MKDKYLVLTAQVISMLFSPFYLPVVALIALFMFSYLSMLPLFYKLFLLGLVYIFTVVLPRLAIFCYRHATSSAVANAATCLTSSPSPATRSCCTSFTVCTPASFKES